MYYREYNDDSDDVPIYRSDYRNKVSVTNLFSGLPPVQKSYCIKKSYISRSMNCSISPSPTSRITSSFDNQITASQRNLFAFRQQSQNIVEENKFTKNYLVKKSFGKNLLSKLESKLDNTGNEDTILEPRKMPSQLLKSQKNSASSSFHMEAMEILMPKSTFAHENEIQVTPSVVNSSKLINSNATIITEELWNNRYIKNSINKYL